MYSIYQSIDHERLLEIILQQGIDYADIRYVENIIDSVLIKDYKKQNEKNLLDVGTGFRLLHKGKEHFFSTNTYDNLGSSVQKLSKNITQYSSSERTTNLYETAAHTSTVKIPAKDQVLANYDDSPDELLSSVSQILIQYLPPDLHFEMLFQLNTLNKHYLSSDDIKVEQDYSVGTLVLSLFSKQNTRTQAFGGIDNGTLNYQYLETEIKQAIQELKDLDRAKLVKKGTYDVVLSHDMAWTLTHETIGHGAEADSVLEDKSFLGGLLGKKVADFSINIIDDPHIRTAGWLEFDDEGTKSTGSIVVEEGILNDYLHSRITALQMGSIPTGNARSESYLDPPVPRQTNTFIEPQDMSHEELLEQIKNGIYVGASNEASVSMYTGEYSLNAQIMYTIKNGEIHKPLNFGLLQGQALETLYNVVGVGKLLKSYPAICYKKNSKVAMGMISPEIAVNDIRVI